MNMLDRDAAREVLKKRGDNMDRWITMDEALDALEGCVRPAPAQTIDRDALARHLCRREFPDRTIEELVAPDRALWQRFLPEADEILALLRPVDVVTLTRDEVTHLRWFLEPGVLDVLEREGHDLRALAQRLESAS